MKRIIVFTLILVMLIPISACKKEPITEPQSTPIPAVGDDGTLTYEFSYNPPHDNYMITWQNFNKDGTEDGKPKTYANTLGGYSRTSGSKIYHVSHEQQNCYVYTTSDGWKIDKNNDYEEWLTEFVDGTDCSAFEDEFMKAFRKEELDTVSGKLHDFYIGTEIIAEVECYIYDSQELNGKKIRYWIDPQNGCCLKRMNTESGEYSLVTVYNLNYFEWTDDLAPSDYLKIGK